MNTKEDYIKKLRDQYNDLNYKWSIERNKLEAKAQRATAEVQKMYAERVESLRQRRDDVKLKLEELDKAGENAWKDIQQGAENAWHALSEAFKKAKSHFD